jgi:SAM-dependent methyltransferase
MTKKAQDDFAYQGSELSLFAHAKNWKAYWTSRLSPYLLGDVLEVGAGLGTNTIALRAMARGRWVCLEPDPVLLSHLQKEIDHQGLAPAECLCGTVATLAAGEKFDTVIYIDVLEHIRDDSAELLRVVRHIRPGGHLIVLSPAYQSLYSEFDRAIGHYRRYNRKTLLGCTPPGSHLALLNYLDACGSVLSFGNRLLLKQSYPTVAQILFWDHWIVPVSRQLDRLTRFRFGKSILAIWQISGSI